MAISKLNKQHKKALKEAAKLLANKKISFDVDDVEIFSSEKSIEVFNDKYQKYFDRKKTLSDVTSFYIMYEWIESLKFKNPLKRAMNIWHHDKVILGARPNLGIRTFTKFISDYSDKHYRITSRPGDLYDRTLKWYRKWYPKMDTSSIRMQNRISKQIDPKFKVNEIKRLNVDVHFEDSFEHAEEIIERTKAVVVLVPQPWNKNYKPSSPRIISNRKTIEPKIISAAKALLESGYN